MFSFLRKKENRERGQAMMVAVIFFICVSVATILGLTNPMVRHISMATSASLSKESFYAAEAGVEDIVYRLRSGLPTASSQNLTVGNHTVTTTIIDESSDKVVTALGEADDFLRKVRTRLTVGTGTAFHYGIQSDVGGIIIENSASVEGNAFANSRIVSSINGRIRGDAMAAGPSGLLDGVYTTGSARAHTIVDSYIEKDAYYQTKTSSTVLGTSYPGSADQPTTTLPISDEMIEEWKSAASLGTVITSPCPYVINSATAIGPAKIECDLEIDGTIGFAVTLGGPVWVQGNINMTNDPIIRISSVLSNRSVPIIADNPVSPLSSGKITLGNSTSFIGASGNSYILVVSQNKSAEQGGNEIAIDVQNTVNGDLLVYAGHGEVLLQNSVSLKEVSGYRLHLKNSAIVIYETGLANLLFTSGPAGGFDITSWKEVE